LVYEASFIAVEEFLTGHSNKLQHSAEKQ